jgi:hypothetical protein
MVKSVFLSKMVNVLIDLITKIRGRMIPCFIEAVKSALSDQDNKVMHSFEFAARMALDGKVVVQIISHTTYGIQMRSMAR